MSSMKRLSIVLCVVTAALLAGGAASAQQILTPGGSQFNPPPLPPPPPPKIEVPAIPQIDALPRQDFQPAPGRSFGDRISRCLDEGAAAGLGPNERAAYSRSCANR